VKAAFAIRNEEMASSGAGQTNAEIGAWYFTASAVSTARHCRRRRRRRHPSKCCKLHGQ